MGSVGISWVQLGSVGISWDQLGSVGSTAVYDHLQCAGDTSDWPVFHVADPPTQAADGSLAPGSLNDANGIFWHRGLYHVMNQGQGGWAHAVSADLVRWYRLPPALVPNPATLQNSTWDRVACDGTLSFPDLGNGSTAVILFGADCGTPLPSAGHLHARAGDAPRVEVAWPADPHDAYLANWSKSRSGPVSFGKSVPCSFPGRIWKSKRGGYWNMLCSYFGNGTWSRYTTTDPRLQSWELADEHFLRGVKFSGWRGRQFAAGALFHRIPNAPPGGPTHLISGPCSQMDGPTEVSCAGATFFVGTYDAQSESMTIQIHEKLASTNSTTPIQPNAACAWPDCPFVTALGSYEWAASGTNGPDPEMDTGRLLTVAWVHPWIWKPTVLSLVRELSWDGKVSQLVSSPVSEIAQLRNATLLRGQDLPLAAGAAHVLPVPPMAAASVDILASFDVPTAATNFGISVRSGTVTVTVQNVSHAADGGFLAAIRFHGGAEPTPAGGITSRSALVRLVAGESLDVRVLVDRSVIECFINNGRAAFVTTALNYSSAKSAITVFNHGGTGAVTARNVSAFQMGCVMTSVKPEPALKHDDVVATSLPSLPILPPPPPAGQCI
eukprot:SAG31_NODE_1923_length_6914_cov_3.243580_7_plen_609_part_00